MYGEDRERILRSVKESVEEAGQRPEDSAYYFVIGLCIAIFAGLIIAMGNIKFKTNQLEVYGQKIQEEVTNPLKKLSSSNDQIVDLNNQVAALEIALSKRIDFAKFISDLTRSQYKKAKWTNLVLNSDKVAITMETDNFDDLQKTLKSFGQMPNVSETSLSEVNVNPDNSKVAFTVELKVDFNAYKVNPGTK